MYRKNQLMLYIKNKIKNKKCYRTKVFLFMTFFCYSVKPHIFYTISMTMYIPDT